MDDKHEEAPTKTPETATPKRASKYFIIGLSLAVFNYFLYTFFSQVIIKNNNLLWLSSLVSTTLTAITAYFAHSQITWKERTPTKIGVFNFFLWNTALSILISPALTWLFGLPKPLYEFAYSISQTLQLPFDYGFIESTGIFVLVNIVTMILNFFFYDRLVFGKKRNQ